MDENSPIWSVCKLGPERFFYAAWASRRDWFGGQPALATGYAATLAEAEAAAQVAAGASAQRIASKFARWEHRRIAAQKRAEAYTSKPQSAAGAAPVEFVYHEFYSNEDGEFRYYPHRVIKRTAKRVFIDSEAYDESWSARRAKTFAEHPEYMETITVDRSELEQTGKASTDARGNWKTFYLTPPEPKSANAVPSYFVILGLTPPCTVDDVKRAYKRKARELHPDNGGSNDEFLALQHAYEQALRASTEAL